MTITKCLTLSVKPNLFILGAPKCGTTALVNWLSQHGSVFVPSVKEPHYFSDEYRLTPTLNSYETLYQAVDIRIHKYACDASVWHLYSPYAVRNILRYSPDAKFVIMLRDPVEMIPSMHEQQVFNGNERIHNLGKALSLNANRLAGYSLGVRNGYPPDHLAYFHSCALGWQVERLVSMVSTSRIHVIQQADMKRNREFEYYRLLEFLGIEKISLSEYPTVNAAKTRRSFLLDDLVLRLASIKSKHKIENRFGILSAIRRLNKIERQRAPISSKIIMHISEVMHDDSKRLSNILVETGLVNNVQKKFP